MVTLLATILVLGALIFVHELGHFLVAKRSGVRVHEFALGFGPRLFGVRRGDTVYSLRVFPLGGFVRMAGMHPEEEDLERVPLRERFFNRSVAERVGIISAGPLANILLAVVLFAILFAAIGVAQPTLVIAEIEEGYPAEPAGLRPGDAIVAIDGERMDSWNELVEIVQRSPGRELALTVERDGREIAITVTPRDEGDGRGIIGVRPVIVHQRYSLVESINQGFGWTGRMVAAFFQALGDLVRGQGAGEIIGPVGIGAEIGEATRTGLPNLVLLTGLLSVHLGLINLLPIPALDGSRLLFLAVEGLRGRPIDPDKESVIHLLGFALMIMLLVFVSIRDVARIF